MRKDASSAKFNELDIKVFADTLSCVLGAPSLDFAPADKVLVSELLSADKALLFHPTSMGQNLVDSAIDTFLPLTKGMIRADYVTPFPPTSAVCFAAAYSGKDVEAKAIKGKKASVDCSTLFDSLAKIGKKSVIVTPDDSVASTLFAGKADVLLAKHDVDAVNIALGVLKKREYDLVAVVSTSYENSLQLSGPTSKLSLKTAKDVLDSFTLLCNAVEVYLKDEDVLVGFCPERGGHKALLGGKSGSMRSSDMNVTHFYAVKRSGETLLGADSNK